MRHSSILLNRDHLPTIVAGIPLVLIAKVFQHFVVCPKLGVFDHRERFGERFRIVNRDLEFKMPKVQAVEALLRRSDSEWGCPFASSQVLSLNPMCPRPACPLPTAGWQRAQRFVLLQVVNAVLTQRSPGSGLPGCKSLATF